MMISNSSAVYFTLSDAMSLRLRYMGYMFVWIDQSIFPPKRFCAPSVPGATCTKLVQVAPGTLGAQKRFGRKMCTVQLY